MKVDEFEKYLSPALANSPDEEGTEPEVVRKKKSNALLENRSMSATQRLVNTKFVSLIKEKPPQFESKYKFVNLDSS